MTKKKLIEALKDFPDNLKVVVVRPIGRNINMHHEISSVSMKKVAYITGEPTEEIISLNILSNE